MTSYYLTLTNINLRAEWDWSVCKYESISDTETTEAEGTEPTSEQALGKAKAVLISLVEKR